MSNSAIRPGSDEEWEELMRQLQSQSKAQPQPFFYARVHTRLITEERTSSSWLLSWIRRPAYLALLGALVLVVSGDGTALRPVAAVNQYNGHHAGPAAQLLQR
jgi:hypothetical protein